MEPHEDKIEREDLARRIREASIRTRAEAEQVSTDYDAANADGLCEAENMAPSEARHPGVSSVE